MKHEDIMIFHKIKYKHIGMLLLLGGAASSYWTVDPKTVTVVGMFSVICCVVLIIAIIVKIIHNWEDEILWFIYYFIYSATSYPITCVNN